jgi:hypothetical protein
MPLYSLKVQTLVASASTEKVTAWKNSEVSNKWIKCGCRSGGSVGMPHPIKPPDLHWVKLFGGNKIGNLIFWLPLVHMPVNHPESIQQVITFVVICSCFRWSAWGQWSDEGWFQVASFCPECDVDVECCELCTWCSSIRLLATAFVCKIGDIWSCVKCECIAPHWTQSMQQSLTNRYSVLHSWKCSVLVWNVMSQESVWVTEWEYRWVNCHVMLQLVCSAERWVNCHVMLQLVCWADFRLFFNFMLLFVCCY